MHDDTVREMTRRYDRQAGDYKNTLAPVLHQSGRRLLRELEGTRPGRVLDVGTGVGTLLPHLGASFPEAAVFACDRSLGMLNHAALAAPGTPKAAMDARHLAVAAESVDLVLAVFVLFLLPDPVEGLREARRVLRSGGHVGTATWGGDLESGAFDVWAKCLKEHEDSEPNLASTTSREAVDTAEKMELVLGEAGFPLARAWTEELVATIGLEQTLRMNVSVGHQKRRFDELAPGVQKACLAEARSRMEGLRPEDFVARAPIVYAVANS